MSGRVTRAGAAVAALAAGVVLVSVGGCKVSTPQREPASVKVKEVLDAGHGHFDLTRPPSREEAGMPAGKDQISYQREDYRPFRAIVALPGGERLDVQADLVGFDAMNAPRPKTDPPTTADINVPVAGPPQARDMMLDLAQRFGLDADLIRTWFDETQAPRPVQAPPTVNSPWLHTQLDWLGFDVRAKYSPPVTGHPDSARTTVHVILTWQPS